MANKVSSCPMWNMIYVQPPEMDVSKNFVSSTIRNNLCNILKEENRISSIRQRLYLEENVFNSLYIRLKNKYRSDKGFKTALKVTNALRSLKGLDIVANVSLVQLILENGEVPRKNVFIWLLVRLQSYAKLLDRVVCCSKKSGASLHYRLKTGHNWLEVSVTISLLSRIWCLANYLLHEACESYNSLKVIIDTIPNDEENWLPEGYILPNDLKIWINERLADWPTYNATCDHNDENLITTKSSVNSTLPCRSSARSNIKIPYTVKGVKIFLKQEEINRSIRLKHYITENMDKLQWNMFKNCLSNRVSKMQNKTIDDKQRLRKEIRKQFKNWIVVK